MARTALWFCASARARRRGRSDRSASSRWLYSQQTQGGEGRTCSGANSDSLSISRRPSLCSLVMTTGSVCVEPWTTRCVMTLRSSFAIACVLDSVRSASSRGRMSGSAERPAGGEASDEVSVRARRPRDGRQRKTAQGEKGGRTLDLVLALGRCLWLAAGVPLDLERDLLAVGADVGRARACDALKRRVGRCERVEAALDGRAAAIEGEAGRRGRSKREGIGCSCEEGAAMSLRSPGSTTGGRVGAEGGRRRWEERR